MSATASTHDSHEKSNNSSSPSIIWLVIAVIVFGLIGVFIRTHFTDNSGGNGNTTTIQTYSVAKDARANGGSVTYQVPPQGAYYPVTAPAIMTSIGTVSMNTDLGTKQFSGNNYLDGSDQSVWANTSLVLIKPVTQGATITFTLN